MDLIKVYADARTQTVDDYNSEHALTADNTLEDITAAIGEQSVLVFHVSNFADGRVFSLIRHARHQGFTGEIVVAGDFALDQANYFVKSGATAFLVTQDKVATLCKTLQDLATGYDGESVSRLPLFS